MSRHRASPGCRTPPVGMIRAANTCVTVSRRVRCPGDANSHCGAASPVSGEPGAPLGRRVPRAGASPVAAPTARTLHRRHCPSTARPELTRGQRRTELAVVGHPRRSAGRRKGCSRPARPTRGQHSSCGPPSTACGACTCDRSPQARAGSSGESSGSSSVSRCTSRCQRASSAAGTPRLVAYRATPGSSSTPTNAGARGRLIPRRGCTSPSRGRLWIGVPVAGTLSSCA